MTDQTKRVSIGWCFICDTNDCVHQAYARQALMESLRTADAPKKEVKLKGLTGEPWRD